MWYKTYDVFERRLFLNLNLNIIHYEEVQRIYHYQPLTVMAVHAYLAYHTFNPI